ncbi:FAS1-like dehydratase domain-containing protein [Acrocarpospora catenulata]|uniref:FAS1-like dehydratase domain-containing protein n=1 Tax=Acrocarpospora catenulata TaxID=2836182 RepID=UPI001BD9227D|nr:MaoC family dehydratase N-terminal domain-containing protein [Acrocarpospora catenulata]
MTDKIKTLEEFEHEYQQGLGEPMHPRPWRKVTEEWLYRFGTGAGDFNPLFRDAEYAAGGRYHELTASPAFIFSVDFGASASIWGHIPESRVSMSDLTILYIGNRVHWYRPIWLGDKVRAIETPIGIKRVEMRQTGAALICTGQTEYWNSRGELVARLENDMLRFVNQARPVESAVAEQGGKVAPDPLVWKRERRGAEPRYWTDVRDGEEIPDLPKGTYTTTELYMFAHLALGGNRSREVDEGTIDMGAGGRADPEYARSSRAQATSFDFGPQRSCWLIQAVSDWAGDHGALRYGETRLKRPNLVGDTNTIRGRVEKKYRDDAGAPLVDVVAENVNQRGEVTASAKVTVRLPENESQLSESIPSLLFAAERSPQAGIYG